MLIFNNPWIRSKRFFFVFKDNVKTQTRACFSCLHTAFISYILAQTKWNKTVLCVKGSLRGTISSTFFTYWSAEDGSGPNGAVSKNQLPIHTPVHTDTGGEVGEMCSQRTWWQCALWGFDSNFCLEDDLLYCALLSVLYRMELRLAHAPPSFWLVLH